MNLKRVVIRPYRGRKIPYSLQHKITKLELQYRYKPEKIRRFRESLSLTREQFAERIGVRAETVWRWENGKGKPCSLALRRMKELEKEREANDAKIKNENLPSSETEDKKSSPTHS